MRAEEMAQERRRIQRIRLDRPVRGRLSGMRVSILDLSTTGARVEHTFPLSSGRRLRLDFLWEEELISLQCDVTRCIAGQGNGSSVVGYSSGLQFCEPALTSRESLKNIISEIVMRELPELKKTLRASRDERGSESPAAEGDSSVTR